MKTLKLGARLMKVKYFRPDIFKIDDLGQEPSIIAIGQIVQAYMPVDRTGSCNYFDMMYESIPSIDNFNKTFEECCMDAAKELWKLGKPIELFWSGGIDSSGALIALLETKSQSDILSIRYTQNSIDEFPLMWEKLVRDKNYPLSDKEMLSESLFEDHGVIKVTGECGDQCFGSDALHKNLDKHADNWETVLTWPDMNQQSREQLAKVLFDQIDTAPIDVVTVFDLFWWCNFCFKWQDVDSRMIFTYTTTPNWNSTLSFFNTADFQRWSIVNHDIKHSGTWETYKQPAKEYINKYIKDETYRKDKTKEPSLLKVLKGSTDEKYDYEFRTKRRNNPQSIKLVLDDGQFWRRNEKVPDEVYETCLTK